MKNKEIEISKYRLGSNILIGYRSDSTLFWLRTDQDNCNLYKGPFQVVEGGKAWIDEESNLTVLDFPTKDKESLSKLKREFLQGREWLFQYPGTDYFVNLSECPLNEVTNIERYWPENESPYENEILKNFDGYIISNGIYLRKNIKTNEMYYFEFSEYTMEDVLEDRFGWIKPAREYSCIESDTELLKWLGNYQKESYGSAWIDEATGILVLGPVKEQQPEMVDNFFWGRLDEYRETYSDWKDTKYWVEIEANRKKTH
jgi:hypothetical protein